MADVYSQLSKVSSLIGHNKWSRLADHDTTHHLEIHLSSDLYFESDSDREFLELTSVLMKGSQYIIAPAKVEISCGRRQRVKG
jgi:hypothetical protein